MPYEYPFNTFPLANKVRILNPSANLDARYGPWSSLNTALSATDGVRELGLTVGVSSVATGVVEYWFKNGIQNSDLVLKTAGGGASSDYLPLSGGTLTGTVSSTRIIILSGIRIPSLSGFSEIRNRDSLNSGFLFTAATATNTNIQNILDISPNNFNFYTNDGKTNFKLYSQNLSSLTLENNTLSGLGSIQINAYDVNIENNLKVKQSLKVENTFTGLEQPSGRRFRDGFGGEVSNVNLQSHNSLFQGDGFSGWTKVYESLANTNLIVSPDSSGVLYGFANNFQGVLYTANITTSAANYDVTFRQINFTVPSETDSIFEVVWMIARYQDINNFYALRLGRSEGDCVIIKRVGGVFTTLKTFTLFDKDYQLSGDKQWILRVYDNYISVIFENILITTVQDNSITQKGLVGIGAGNLGFRGNDSIPNFTWNNFVYQEFNGFEQHSYILNNNFGVGTKIPNEKLTVLGNISASNLIYSSNGNSQEWSSVYSSVCSLSAIWNATSNNASVYSTVNSFSSNWSSGYTTWNNASANLIDGRTFNNNNSSSLIQIRTEVFANSGSWNSSYSVLCSLSTKWNTPYDTQLNVNSTNAVENSAVAVRIQGIENSLNLIVSPPTYNAPIATLSNFSPSLLEVGELIVQNISVNWTQNDAGSVTNPFFVLTRNGFLVNQSINPFTYSVNERAILGTTNYQNTVTFSDGPIKNNILGLPDTRGRILSGSVSQTRSYEGKYRQFFGSVSAVPTNLRTLTGNNFSETTQGNEFSFFAHQTRNILVIPSNRKLSFAQTQNFQDVTSEFTSSLSAILFPDANSVLRNYKRYIQTTAVPLNLRIDFTITAE